MKSRSAIKLGCLFVLALLVVGCGGGQATRQAQLYNTLTGTAELYNQTMTEVRHLQDIGLISDEARAKINDKAEKFYAAYRAAVRVFVAVKLAEDESGDVQLAPLVREAERLFLEFLEITEPLLLEAMKER